eukprot:12848546-Prorocentrum_lima.AAC.1
MGDSFHGDVVAKRRHLDTTCLYHVGAFPQQHGVRDQEDNLFRGHGVGGEVSRRCTNQVGVG